MSSERPLNSQGKHQNTITIELEHLLDESLETKTFRSSESELSKRIGRFGA